MSSRRARQRAHHPRRAATNAVQMAINGAALLPADDVRGMLALTERALREFARGVDCRLHWSTLADTANMAETLASMGLGSGDQADDVIGRAQQALHDVHQRAHARGTYTLYADEIDALHWLVRLYVVQLGACSQREFEAAYIRTRDRIHQAAVGNAAPGTCVVVGLVGHRQPEA